MGGKRPWHRLITWSSNTQKSWVQKISFRRFNRCGSAAAVRAMIGILGKNALTADRSLNSLLNSSAPNKMLLYHT